MSLIRLPEDTRVQGSGGGGNSDRSIARDFVARLHRMAAPGVYPLASRAVASQRTGALVNLNILMGCGRANDMATSIYATCIEMSPCSATAIARRLGLDVSQVYTCLAAGIAKGLDITVTPGRPPTVPRRYTMRYLHTPRAGSPADLTLAGLCASYVCSSGRPQPGQAGRNRIAK